VDYWPVDELVVGWLLLVVPEALLTPVAPVAPEFQLEVPPVVLGVAELPVDELVELEPLMLSLCVPVVSQAARPKAIMPARTAL
jgi:hypothetical protein